MKKKLYLTIYENLKSEIEDGSYKYGDKLPSKRTLAENSNMSIITVEHALNLLLEEGYIKAKERSGYFVIYKVDDSYFGSHESSLVNNKSNFIQEKLIDDSSDKYIESLNYSKISRELFPFSNYASSIRRVLSEYGKDILIQSENQGSLILRQAISNYLRRNRNIKCDASQIIIGSGAEYLYGIIVEILGIDKTYALENPSYGKIQQVYESKGAKTTLLCLENDGIKSVELTKKFDVLHITPYRSFPSNITASASKKREYINWQSSTGGIIIEDDFTSEFSPSLKPVDTIYSKCIGNAIYINTFSQTISPATRIAYMVLPQTIIEKYKNRTGFYSCTVSTLDQYALADFINNGSFERHLNRVRRKIKISNI